MYSGVGNSEAGGSKDGDQKRCCVRFRRRRIVGHSDHEGDHRTPEALTELNQATRPFPTVYLGPPLGFGVPKVDPLTAIGTPALVLGARPDIFGLLSGAKEPIWKPRARQNAHSTRW